MKKWLQFHDRNLLTIVLMLVFTWSVAQIPWSKNLIHPGGWSTLSEIVVAMLHPDLSWSIVSLAWESVFITLTYAITGMSIAILIGFLFGLLASGVLTNQNKFYRPISVAARSLLGFLRAIHELIWAWLFVSSFGLHPYAAILAIALPYGGILGRIFADMLNDVPKGPITALQSLGASKVQQLVYGYFPLVRSEMLSYTMYRFECAVRSSAVMSFVGLGGLGFQIQLSLNDLKYQEVWTFVYFLLALVVCIDWWSSHWRSSLQSNNARFLYVSPIVALLFIVLAWGDFILSGQASLLQIFNESNLTYAKKFLSQLLGIGEEYPAFLSLESWKMAIALSYDTIIMSVLAIGMATIVMLLTVIPASRNVMSGKRTLFGTFCFWLIRATYVLSRAVPELIWAMMIIFIFKPGIVPGAIALALHNFGILGKLCAEVIDEMDQRPLKQLSSVGANFPQLLFYGVIPSVFPRFLSYILYRFEVIMRTTVVVGFVGAGGLGQQFKLSMSYFHYSDITLLLICYLLLVWFSDLLSEASRKWVSTKHE